MDGCLTLWVGELHAEADHIPDHQPLGPLRMDGTLHGDGNVVQNAGVSALLHGEKSQTHVDGPHVESVVAGPDPDLHQVVSAHDSRKTHTVSLRERNYYCNYVASCLQVFN